MNDNVDVKIVRRVIKRMNLPKGRDALDAATTQEYTDTALRLIKLAEPSVSCKSLFETYFQVFGATENECLKAWALFLDYKSMSTLYGLQGETTPNIWGGGGLAAAV